MNLKSRFMSFVKKGWGCWKWTGSLNSAGYGQLVVRGRTRLAHRLMWTMTLGKIPKGKNILHKCRVRRCVNPGHLEIGNASQRMKDCYNKGGRPRPVGELGSAHKLTWNQVREIRAMKLEHGDQRRLAIKYGVSAPTMWEVIHQHTWKETT